MDFAKKYGALGGNTVWVDLDDAKIELIPRYDRKSKMETLGSLSLAEYKALANPESLDQNTTTIADQAKLDAKVTATNIAGWKNLTIDGEQIEFSKDKAVELCYLFPEFRFFVDDQLYKLDLKYAEQQAMREEIKKK